MKTQNYSIRLSDLMKEQITKQAQKNHMITSEYIRLIIQREIDKEEANKCLK